MNTLPIGPADMEHYYGGVVRRLAISMARVTDAEWEIMAVKRRIRWLDRAAKAASLTFADPVVISVLPRLHQNLVARS